ncbi:MAG: sodium:solute symporter family protein, partial [Bacteroidota bacterium]
MTPSASFIDIAIFVVFLAFNLLVGLFYGRRVNDMRDYAIGRKDFSTATLTATIVVSWIGGRDPFYMLEHVYRDGLYFVLVILGAGICLLLVGRLAIRMEGFLNNFSIAEAIGDLYGTQARIIAAISGVLSVIGVIAIEFQVVSKIITLLFGVEGPSITVVSAIIVMVYSVFGGIRSVTFTESEELEDIGK